LKFKTANISVRTILSGFKMIMLVPTISSLRALD
jgi:hypothetical protein